MSRVSWFSDSSTASAHPSRRTVFPYIPSHLRTQHPDMTLNILPPNTPTWRRRINPSNALHTKPSNAPHKPEDQPVDPSQEEECNNVQPSPVRTGNDVVDAAVEATGVDIPPPAASFAEMRFFADALTDNIKMCKYVTPTPIQRYAIPVAMAGRDLMACAQTGSGKTAAFCFPIINGIVADKQTRKKMLYGYGGVRGMAFPVALILAPTRELASQIHEEAKKFSRQTGVKVTVAYGGTPIAHQLRNLGGVDILVATPGRLVDMIERSKVSLRMVKYLAMDEADRMLDMGFEPQIRKIVQQMEMPPSGERQTMLFSATFPTEIQRLASDFLSNYIFLAAGKVGSSTDLISQRVEFVPDLDKRNYLVELLRSQMTNGTTKKDALTLVFVETKRGADALEGWLSRKGFPSIAIHGDKVQMERERALKSFRSGSTPILVATDVAARGLDIPHVAHVINFDLPRAVEDYVHRIGRTGRAGKSGLATAFFSEKNAPLANALVQLMQGANQAIPAWLKEYAETSPTKTGYGRSFRHVDSSKYSGRDSRRGYYEDCNDNGDYSSQFTDGGADYVDTRAIVSPHKLTNGDDCYASSPYSYPKADPFNSESYNCVNGYESVVATGWD